MYTTTIEENKVTEAQKNFAAKIEREILAKDANGNLHLAEERQQRLQDDMDESGRYGYDESEEMKYSGVYRTNNQQSGKPPRFIKQEPK